MSTVRVQILSLTFLLKTFSSPRYGVSFDLFNLFKKLKFKNN